ncbi:MAG: oligosaccharide flippase family protein [Candidatus Delongbacteria bacterium]|nr:oligosaccharide flippase family protein [Candidatus Cloacimonadota bacterium]MCB9473825.1 oligosaccharide flippase family protein [Candidatus Delongbacteria bacterium]
MLKSSLAIFSNRLLVRVINLLLAVLVARVLGPELQGIVSFMVMQAGLLLSLAVLGMDSGLIYFVRRMNMSEAEFLRRAWPLMSLGILVVSGLVAVLYPWPLLGFSRYAPILVVVTCCIFAVDTFGSVLRQIFLVRDQVKRFNRFELTQSLLLLGLTALGLAFFPQAVLPVLLAMLVSRLATLLWMGARNHVPVGRWTLRGSSPILAYSLQPWLGNLFSLLNLRLDTIFVSWFIGLGMGVTPADLGFYTICVLAIGRAQDVQVAIQTAFFPTVAGLPIEEGASLAARVYRLTFPLYALLALVVCLGGYPALWAFGPEYLAAWPTLCVLSAGLLLVRANSGVLALWFSSTGRPAIPSLLNLLGVALNIAFNLVWIPRFGIMGAAMATAVSALGVKLGLVSFYLYHSKRSWTSDLMLRPAELRESLDLVRSIAGRRFRRGGPPKDNGGNR